MESLEVSEQFWRGRKVFVTGHTGFKGSWISLWLQALGAEVSGYALEAPTKPSLFEQARVAEGMRSFIGDVRDLPTLRAEMQRSQPEVVIHMAAQPLVLYSYANPVETYSTNVMGTVHLLEAVRACPSVRAVVVVTSDKCYENQEWLWGYRESEPMGGHDPYSNSKGCAELVTSAYRRSFFSRPAEQGGPVAVASARAGNVIGGGDWAMDRLIPDMIRAFGAGQAVRIRHPNAVRPWQHVLEPLSGYLHLARGLLEQGTTHAEGWNFGPGEDDARPVRWLVEQLVAQWPGGACWELDPQAQLHEAASLKLDCSKARARLGWRPRWDLGTALERIVRWHAEQARGGDMRAFTLHQIKEYQTWTS
ncbi:CDP-glucose 4,6-dehydratase [Thiomonas sp.]|uniref:CDP-glucose 4,6-dehydratase n=1 Tax=Thiomonas sp. TaxID=2047785 RepID=UPI0026186C1B|nr:CDP-glucose 4,6-dehydratase [Thiomonas sp.]